MRFKKILLAAIFVMMLCGCASAFAKRGYIPGCDQLVYRGLSVTERGVTVTLFNRSESTVLFNAALAFVDSKRSEVGDAYIAKTEIAPNESVTMKDLYLKGDYRACRAAESLRWTIYALEIK